MTFCCEGCQYWHACMHACSKQYVGSNVRRHMPSLRPSCCKLVLVFLSRAESMVSPTPLIRKGCQISWPSPLWKGRTHTSSAYEQKTHPLYTNPFTTAQQLHQPVFAADTLTARLTHLILPRSMCPSDLPCMAPCTGRCKQIDGGGGCWAGWFHTRPHSFGLQGKGAGPKGIDAAGYRALCKRCCCFPYQILDVLHGPAGMKAADSMTLAVLYLNQTPSCLFLLLL